VGRPREFDEPDVVAKARDAFWAKGISATSISDLSDATGLSVGSIYKAFESKNGLCFRTLDDYLDGALESVATVLGSEASPLQGLRAWFADAAVNASADSPTRGCYGVICATELAEGNPKIRKRLKVHDRRLRALVAQTLRAAADAGELSIDPALGARLVCTTLNGLQVESRKGISLADAEATLETVIRALR